MTTAAEPTVGELAVVVYELLLARGETVAVAESLTGGGLGAALTGVAGASATFRGGVIAYATELKAALLSVDPELLAERGAVDADVARAMAAGVRDRLGATYGLATTGVAGPDPQDGHEPGEVHVAVAGPAGTGAVSRSVHLVLAGDRTAVRHGSVLGALDLLRSVLTGNDVR